MSNLTDHARRELELAGFFKDEGVYGDLLGKAVLELVEKFSEQGHSGGSAPIAVSTFARVAMFEPLGPLTGADDEWTEVGDGVMQNRRCSHVFRDKNGVAYDIQGRVFREPSGACYTTSESRVVVTFPYAPKIEYVDVPGPGQV